MRNERPQLFADFGEGLTLVESARMNAAAKAGKAAEKASSGKPGKMIYFFSKSKTDGNGSMKPLLGGKGANLAAMTSIGLPVPPGFTITTDVCTFLLQKRQKSFPPDLAERHQIVSHVAGKKKPARSSATRKNPLLVSVRSGARDSMPGMMDTILNLGPE